MIKNYTQQLTLIPLFQNITEEELNAMMLCMNPPVRTYKKSEIIAIAGDPLVGVGLVLEGETEVMRENAAGSKMIISFLEAGDIFGEMAAFSGRKAWPATVTAKKDCTVLFIPQDKFLGNCANACAFHKTLIQNMLKIISEKAIMLNRKVEYLGIKSMRGKICTYLLEQYQIYKTQTFILPINKNELADYLNVSRPSMSREFSRLRDEGVLNFYLSSIRLIDIAAIRKMALS